MIFRPVTDSLTAAYRLTLPAVLRHVADVCLIVADRIDPQPPQPVEVDIWISVPDLIAEIASRN